MAIFKGVDWVAISTIAILFLGILFIPYDGWLNRMAWKVAVFMQKRKQCAKNPTDKYFCLIEGAVGFLAFIVLKIFFNATTLGALAFISIAYVVSWLIVFMLLAYAISRTRDEHTSIKKG